MFKKYLVLTLTILITGFSATVFAAPQAVYKDYFGTGRTSYLDFVRSQNANLLRWDLLRNPVTSPPQIRRVIWGYAYDQPVYGDFDGDLKYDIGVYRFANEPNKPSHFYIQRSSDNSLLTQPWGTVTGEYLQPDFPVLGFYDDDSKTDFAVVRGEENKLVWYILQSATGNHKRIVWGGLISDYEFDFPLSPSADFNGDGRDDLAVVRLNGQTGDLTFYVGDAQTGASILTQQWGNLNATDYQAVTIGDYMGDSRADVVVVYSDCQNNPGCPLGATWWIKETGSNNQRVVKFGNPFGFGVQGDIPDEGDYDGDGKRDISVIRPSTGTFYHLLSSNGQTVGQQWSGIFGSSSGTSAVFNDLFKSPQQETAPSVSTRMTLIKRNANGKITVQRRNETFPPR